MRWIPRPSEKVLLWLISTAGIAFKFGLGLGFQPLWLHSIMQNMFPLHRLGVEIWIPFPNGYCTHFRKQVSIQKTYLCPHYIHFNQRIRVNRNQWKNPAYCSIVQESLSESESESGIGNKPLAHETCRPKMVTEFSCFLPLEGNVGSTNEGHSF